jgi:hypothetical protein
MDEVSDVNRARREELLAELKKSINHHRRWQRLNFLISVFLMGAIVLASFAAPTLAALDADKQWVAVAALTTGVLVGWASMFNPGGRAEWHDRRKNALNWLRRRLFFEIGDSPTEQQIASISSEWSEFDRLHQREAAQMFILRPEIRE